MTTAGMLRLPSRQEEERLLAALKSGSQSAWAEAMRLYGGAMLATARSLAPSQAEDITQEAWIAACQGIARFEGRASLKTWLVRIAMNCAYNHLRRKQLLVPLDGLDPQQDPLAGAFSDNGHWRQRFESWTDD